ncbi:serine protease AprX [Peribacillus deserti]|uniref:Serine protease AprX n=1 Tax=Peribacillus deserti TaxID=673318 RepID=A0ABS2QL54_9BACI|nr:S8 family serine peptidase [Peribacillus deserti]MBM7693837.1 serine protease AprX [Peribacillus deserti]
MKIKAAILSAFLFTSVLFGSLLSLEANAQEMKAAYIDPNLSETLVDSVTPVEVIVTFKNAESVSSIGLQTLKDAGITKGFTFNKLPIAGVLATKVQVNKLAEQEEVLSIYLNKKLQYENEEATQLTGVDQIRTNETMRTLNGGLPVSGKGIGVLINDSGVDGTHKDLQFGQHLVQNILGSTNLHAVDTLLPVSYVEDVPNTDNNSGHGTHVAGIVGGTGAMSGGKYEGAAPGADLIGYGSGAALAMLDTLGGFDYALTHQQAYNIRVITNSWGDTSDSGTEFDPYNPINIATKKLYDKGITTVFSAGNSGPGESTISGNYKKAPWVVTVAAGDKSRNLADFSSRGKKDAGGTVTVDGQTWTWEDRPTITSPGVNIVSTRVLSPIPLLGAADDAQFISPAFIPYYTTMSGTSMAAPHVAGIIALMLEANQALSPAEVKNILKSTAAPMAGHEAWETGSGYVNAFGAVERAFGIGQ